MKEEVKNEFKNLSIEKIMEIQLALKQLGYEINGHHFKRRGEIVIRLKEIRSYVRIDDGTVIDDFDEVLAIKNS